jgi:hypothetical protein
MPRRNSRIFYFLRTSSGAGKFAAYQYIRHHGHISISSPPNFKQACLGSLANRLIWMLEQWLNRSNICCRPDYKKAGERILNPAGIIML